MAALSRSARLIGFNGSEEEEVVEEVEAKEAKEPAGRVRGAAREVRVPAGSRVTRAAGTRGGWVLAAGPLRIPRGRHWPAAGIVRRAAPAGTLRRSLGRARRRSRTAHPVREKCELRAPAPAGSAARPLRSLCSLVRRPTPNFFFFICLFNCLLFLRMNDLSLLS